MHTSLEGTSLVFILMKDSPVGDFKKEKVIKNLFPFFLLMGFPRRTGIIMNAQSQLFLPPLKP